MRRISRSDTNRYIYLTICTVRSRPDYLTFYEDVLCLFVYLFVCLFICLFVYLFISFCVPEAPTNTPTAATQEMSVTQSVEEDMLLVYNPQFFSGDFSHTTYIRQNHFTRCIWSYLHAFSGCKLFFVKRPVTQLLISATTEENFGLIYCFLVMLGPNRKHRSVICESWMQ